MALAQARQERADLAPHALLLAAHAPDRGEAERPRVRRRQILRHERERADEAQPALARTRDRRQRRDAAVEENVAQQRLGAVVRRVAQGEDGRAELARDRVQRAATVTAADV